MSGVPVAVAVPPEGPLTELVELAVEAEGLGCRTLWVNDDRLQKDVFTVLAAIAQGTGELRLGPGVTNPYSRHPALLATAIAPLHSIQYVISWSTWRRQHQAQARTSHYARRTTGDE